MFSQSKIKKIIDFLKGLDVIPKEQDCSWHLKLSDFYSFLIYITRTEFIQVKMNNKESLFNEHVSLQSAYDVLPKEVPFSYGVHQFEEEDVLITRGIRHRPMMGRGRSDISKFEQLHLYYFFKTCHCNFKTAGPMQCNINLLENQDGYLKDKLNEILVLPGVNQHSDLALTNIGVAKKNIVVFDWEDFGSVTLPYYDLAIFLCSFYDFNIDLIFKVLLSPRFRMHHLIKDVLSLSNIEVTQYQSWIPVYLYLFSVMKSKLGYSLEVIDLSLKAANKSIQHLDGRHVACAI